MASKRKQLSIHLDRETEELAERLIPIVSQVIGLKMSQSDLLRLGIQRLRDEFMPQEKGPDALGTRGVVIPPVTPMRRRAKCRGWRCS